MAPKMRLLSFIVMPFWKEGFARRARAASSSVALRALSRCIARRVTPSQPPSMAAWNLADGLRLAAAGRGAQAHCLVAEDNKVQRLPACQCPYDMAFPVSRSGRSGAHHSGPPAQRPPCAPVRAAWAAPGSANARPRQCCPGAGHLRLHCGHDTPSESRRARQLSSRALPPPPPAYR